MLCTRREAWGWPVAGWEFGWLARGYLLKNIAKAEFLAHSMETKYTNKLRGKEVKSKLPFFLIIFILFICQFWKRILGLPPHHATTPTYFWLFMMCPPHHLTCWYTYKACTNPLSIPMSDPLSKLLLTFWLGPKHLFLENLFCLENIQNNLQTPKKQRKIMDNSKSPKLKKENGIESIYRF